MLEPDGGCRRQDRLLGGPGDDVLIGGPFRDYSDYCVAEVRRDCERP